MLWCKEESETVIALEIPAYTSLYVSYENEMASVNRKVKKLILNLSEYKNFFPDSSTGKWGVGNYLILKLKIKHVILCIYFPESSGW